MRIKVIQAVRSAMYRMQGLLAVRLPMAAVYGLRMR
jgi:hypothetical protein